MTPEQAHELGGDLLRALLPLTGTQSIDETPPLASTARRRPPRRPVLARCRATHLRRVPDLPKTMAGRHRLPHRQGDPRMSDKPTTAEQFAEFFAQMLPTRGLAELFATDQPDTEPTNTEED